MNREKLTELNINVAKDESLKIIGLNADPTELEKEDKNNPKLS